MYLYVHIANGYSSYFVPFFINAVRCIATSLKPNRCLYVVLTCSEYSLRFLSVVQRLVYFVIKLSVDTYWVIDYATCVNS